MITLDTIMPAAFAHILCYQRNGVDDFGSKTFAISGEHKSDQMRKS